MKKLLLSASAIALLFTACKKDDDNNGSSNSFKIGSTTYNAVAVTADANFGAIGAADASGNGFTVLFAGDLPTANGTYNISNSILLDSNEVYVAGYRASDSASYTPSMAVNASATITVSGGKISVTVPSIMAVGDNGDSTLISANIKQTN